MAQILIRNLDPEIVGQLKARAKTTGRSLQCETKKILEEAAVGLHGEHELTPADALRLATAAGAATVATNGSATELGSIEDYSEGVTLHSIGEIEGDCR